MRGVELSKIGFSTDDNEIQCYTERLRTCTVGNDLDFIVGDLLILLWTREKQGVGITRGALSAYEIIFPGLNKVQRTEKISLIQ